MREKMKIGVISAPYKAEVMEVNKPVPGKNELLIRLKACALCTFEQRMFTGAKKVKFPYLGGHEVVGEVAEIGEGVNRWSIGDKVAVRTLAHCGQCYYCQQGEDNLCEETGKLPPPIPEVDGIGGLSEYLLVTPNQLFKYDTSIKDEVGVFAEPLACVIHSIERANLKLGQDVVVVGAGVMGLLHLAVAKKKGTRVIVCEVDEKRRKLALELGADYVINPIEEDMAAIVKKLTWGRGADAVFHTTALTSVAESAIKLVGKMGTVIMYGSFYPDNDITVNPNWIHNTEVIITGSVSPSTEDFLKATRLLNSGIIDPKPLVQELFELKDIQKAFERAADPSTFRVIVKL